jgi:hypothetical protein
MSLALSPTQSKGSARTPEPAANNRRWPKSIPNALTLVNVSSSDEQPNVVVVAGGANVLAFKSFLVHAPADTGMVFVPLQQPAPPHSKKLARATKTPLMEFRDPTVEPW